MAATLISLDARGATRASAGELARQTLLEAGLDAAVVARLAAGLANARVQRERIDRPSGLEPLEIVFLLRPASGDQSQRIVDTTVTVIGRLNDWFGPIRTGQLTVVDVPWATGLAGAAYPGVVMTSTRWLSEPDDRALERALIGGLARQYWLDAGRGTLRPGWFGEGLVLYTGTRAIHEALEGRHFAVERFFNGVVPRRIPSVQLSWSPSDPRPRVASFDELTEPAIAPWRWWTTAPGAEARRVAVALWTLERYVGWPALQPALAGFRDRAPDAPATPETLFGLLSEQRGVDLRWFADEAFRFSARVDYAVDRFDSEPAEGAAPLSYRTTVSLRRMGEGLFPGTSRSTSDAHAVTFAVRFADGTEVRDGWDGRESNRQFAYASRSRAVSVSVDPDAVLLIDVDRSNNTRTLASDVNPTGVRLALYWLVWLENLMLTGMAVA